MSCCSLTHGKLEAYIGVRVSADVFHDIFSCRPHHVSNMAPNKIKSCDIHEGQWGEPGSVVLWHFIHDGEEKVSKSAIEEIDNVNLSTTYNVVGGDILKEYKKFKIVVKAAPQKKNEGEDWCLVHWVMDYEKLKEETPEPFSLLEFAVHMSKDIDDHHTKKE